jgi:hypothetical protein
LGENREVSKKVVYLKTGTLEFEDSPKLNSLVSFGSRMNRKRRFLFVSKVLGKHLPTKPSVMKKNFREMKEKVLEEIDTSKKTLFIGFAETATALGQGVFEELFLENSFYIHTTRYQTSKEKLLEFREEHSHAPSHILYKPDFPLDCENIVLVDDEVSTGKTTLNIVKELKTIFPNANYFSISMLDWSEVKSDVKFLSLHSGKFEFTSKEFEIPKVISENPKAKNLVFKNFGRFGVSKKLDLDFSFLNLQELTGKRVLVLGTSEFMYPPYLLAKYLEERSVDVYFQATTRSPVNVDGVIESKLSFKDNYFEEIDNFLYNLIEYEKIIICYETEELPKSFQLKKLLEREGYSVDEVFF